MKYCFVAALQDLIGLDVSGQKARSPTPPAPTGTSRCVGSSGPAVRTTAVAKYLGSDR